MLQEKPDGALEHVLVARHLYLGGYVHGPALRRCPFLLPQLGNRALDQGSQLDGFRSQLVAVLLEPLDGEVIVHQTTHPPERAKGGVDHLVRAGSRAVGRVHTLEEIAGPESGRERVLDLVGDEPEVLPAAPGWHIRGT